MKKKEVNKIINSLMSFYTLMAAIYEQSAYFETPVISGLMTRVHLQELLNFHKAKTVKEKILVPKLDELYEDYLKEWGVYIRGKEEYLKKIIDDHKKTIRYSYIS